MTQVARLYAEALYSLCLEENMTADVLVQVKLLQQSFREEPAFIRLLSSPAIPKEERRKITEDSFCSYVNLYVLHFLKLLLDKGHLRHFDDCCQAYQALYNQDNGILLVTAITAKPLTAEQMRRLRKKLDFETGQTVALTNRVDPAVIGGMCLDFDGKRLDDTLLHRLDAIRHTLSRTVL